MIPIIPTRLRAATFSFISLNLVKILKWGCVGLLFMAIGVSLLYFFVDILALKVWVASLLTGEISTLLRYFINCFWVFGLSKISLNDCLKYHIANIAGFIIWMITANVLTLLGFHYLLAGVFAVAFSVVFSFFTNFFWVWKDSLVRDKK